MAKIVGFHQIGGPEVLLQDSAENGTIRRFRRFRRFKLRCLGQELRHLRHKTAEFLARAEFTS
jgi:hypothetical protein